MAESFIEQQNVIRNDYVDENRFTKHRPIWKVILCNTTVQGWVFIVSFAVVVPFLTYYLVVDQGSYKIPDTFTCYVNKTFRVPCGKINITEKDCINVACCYDKPTRKCYHYLPSRYSYDLVGDRYQVSRKRTPLNTKIIDVMKMTINEINADELSIYLHQENYVIPSDTVMENKNYVVKKTAEKLMVEVFRPSGELLLSTAKGPLIASENYWEWTIYLTDHSLFGMNQTLITLDENSTFTKIFYNNKNDQSSMPVFWAYKHGNFHGISVNHSGPLELTVLPSNLILLKSLTGGIIELRLSVGPTPKLLHDQQMKMDNRSVDNLPFWLLGNHMCRKQQEFFNMSSLVQSFSLDSQADSYCIDDDLFMYLLRDDIDNYNDTEELNQLLTQLSDQGKKFFLSIPPQLLENTTLYYAAESSDLFYKFNDTTYQGLYQEVNVSYPDYAHPQIQSFIEEVDNFLQRYINITIDGLVLKDNWPVNEAFKMDNASFPYFTNDFQDAMSYTIQWNATSNNVSHILKHNSYGASQLDAFTKYYNSLNQPKVIMSSTKLLSQTQHRILENIDVSWDNLRDHIVNLLFESITGNHLVSLPVCGDTTVFNSTLQENLCLRWYIVAATMPLFRISSPQPWRNPEGMRSKYGQQMAKDIVSKRKMFVPYYYDILLRNEPVLRPMFYDYYENTTTFSMKRQYMVGEKLLVAHPLTPDRTQLDIYLPPRVKVWYEFWGGKMYNVNKTKPYIHIDVRDSDFLLFIAQGSIVPLVETTTINLIVALNCTNGSEAEGSIQIDTLNIKFKANDQQILVNASDTVNYLLGYIKLYQYVNNTGQYNTLVKNKNLTETSIIYYEDPTTTEPTTTTQEPTTPPETTTEEPTTPTEPDPVTTISSESTVSESSTTASMSSDLTTSNSDSSSSSESTTSDSTASGPTTPDSTASDSTTSTSTSSESTTPISSSSTASSSESTSETITETSLTSESTSPRTSSSTVSSSDSTTSEATSTSSSRSSSSSASSSESTTADSTVSDSSTITSASSESATPLSSTTSSSKATSTGSTDSVSSTTTSINSESTSPSSSASISESTT